MKKLNLSQKSKEELTKQLGELKKDLMRLNTQRSTVTVPENPGNIKKFRRMIARINTILNNKQSEVKNEKKWTTYAQNVVSKLSSAFVNQ